MGYYMNRISNALAPITLNSCGVRMALRGTGSKLSGVMAGRDWMSGRGVAGKGRGAWVGACIDGG